MDYHKYEEKLMIAQNKVQSKAKHLELLSKIDREVKKIETKMPDKIKATVKVCENLSVDNKFSLPLYIKGKMLGVGRHKEKYYTEEALVKSIDSFVRRIPCKLDHRRKEVASTIGAIDKIYWDSILKAVMYEGHINDETQARNVLDGLITDVSASVFSVDEYDAIHGLVGRELEYSELSFVEKGAFTGNTVEAVI